MTKDDEAARRASLIRPIERCWWPSTRRKAISATSIDATPLDSPRRLARALFAHPRKTSVNRTLCGGKRRRDGLPCQARSEPGKQRCRFHGGRSTGPRTEGGKARALANLKQFRKANTPARPQSDDVIPVTDGR
jgi:hypothetical protein